LVLAVATLVGSGYGLIMTGGLRELAERVDARERGAAVGIYYVMTYIGFALPFVHARVAASVGDVAALEMTAAAVGACALLRAFMPRS